MVSTSGSSGTLDLPPRDVAAPGLAFKLDALRRGPAGCGGSGHVGAQPGHTEYAASGGPQPAVGIAVGAGMKDDHVFAQLIARRKIDRYAFLGVLRIAAGREHRRHRGAFGFEQRLPGGRAPTTHPNVSEVLGKTARERGEKHLSLGSPKRALNSSTLGVPSGSIIRPAYSTPS